MPVGLAARAAIAKRSAVWVLVTSESKIASTLLAVNVPLAKLLAKVLIIFPRSHPPTKELRGDIDLRPQGVYRVSAQEQTVKQRRLSLRRMEIAIFRTRHVGSVEQAA